MNLISEKKRDRKEASMSELWIGEGVCAPEKAESAPSGELSTFG